MINIKQVLESYDFNNITIGVLGGHSALDLCAGAKKLGFKTLVVAQKGRERTYTEHYKVKGDKGCVDEVLVVEQFADMIKPEVQEQLRKKNTIFVHNRYFWVYFNFHEIENNFNVPIYGTRNLLRLEERDVEKNQYWLLKQAGIRIPKIIRESYLSRSDLEKTFHEYFTVNKGGPVIVKVNEAQRTYERAFFVITSADDYFAKSNKMLAKGQITQEALDKSVIEEFIIGAQVNFNFFYSNVRGELELMGTDARRQTSLDGFLRLDAKTQMDLLESGYAPSMVETGHFNVTTKESLIEKMYEIGEKFVEITKKHADPGIIGPFALQGAVASESGKEELVIFDVSMRIPGSPGTKFTPYTGYMWGKELSYGDRIVQEFKEALEQNILPDLLT